MLTLDYFCLATLPTTKKRLEACLDIISYLSDTAAEEELIKLASQIPQGEKWDDVLIQCIRYLYERRTYLKNLNFFGCDLTEEIIAEKNAPGKIFRKIKDGIIDQYGKVDKHDIDYLYHKYNKARIAVHVKIPGDICEQFEEGSFMIRRHEDTILEIYKIPMEIIARLVRDYTELISWDDEERR